MSFKYQDGDIVGDYNVKMIKRLYKKPPRIWYAEFECPYDHKIFIARINDVASNKTKSCGCLHSEQAKINGRLAKPALMHDLTGKWFGYLEVLGEATAEYKKDYRNGIVWKCFCHKCNTECYLSQESLHKGTQSCGCISSKGEETIAAILQQLDINAIAQYSPKDLFSPQSNRRLRFDFYIPQYNIIIEYDGIQHFKVGGWATKEKLEQIQQYDEVKNQYCRKRGIKLIRIPYTDYDKLNNSYILSLLDSDEKRYNEQV